jgi:SAM-dependent methyltransferase
MYLKSFHVYRESLAHSWVKRGKHKMTVWSDWRKRLGGSYWLWRVYHAVVSDAVSLQRPTKFKRVYEYLAGDLGRAADIGCGPGVFLPHLHDKATVVFAVDADEATLRSVKARHGKLTNLRCVRSLVDQLPFRDGQLDTVLFLEVLEHLTDDSAGLREVHRVLVPGGKLVLSVPMPPGEINPDDPWGHKREGYTFAQLQGLLTDQGFELQKHSFAQFKFSRFAEILVRRWRQSFRVPAPIFLSWFCYLDFLLSAQGREKGDYLPSCVMVMARKV